MTSKWTREQDNLIDWSSFDEIDERDLPPVEGSFALRILSVVLLVGSVVGIVFGIVQLRDAIAAAAGGIELGRVFLIIGVSFFTFIPAAFGLQTAGGGSVTPALVLSAFGILLPLTSLLLSMWYGASAYLWLILEIPALLYVFLVLRVKHGIDTHRRLARGYMSRKDELWDEDKIWR